MKNMIKIIKNEKDHSNALKYIESLIDAKKGTVEADIRDVLAVLIEDYEKIHYAIPHPTPIEAIKFRMEQEGLTQNDLIPCIGSRSKVSEVLSGKKELTLKMIRALHKHLGIPADILIQQGEQKLPEDFKELDFDKFPIMEMAKNGAFEGFDVSNLTDKPEEAIRFLIDKVGGKKAIPEGLFRKTNSTRLNAKLDQYALQGWSLALLAKASENKKITKFEKKDMNDAFIKGLASLSILDDGPCKVKEYLEKCGIIFIYLPHFKNTYLDGASFITTDNRAVIGLTLRYDRIDNFCFTLFHELGHLKKHLNTGNFIADDMSLKDSISDSSIEIEADEFAEVYLIGRNFKYDNTMYVTPEQIEEYARELNINKAIIAGHMQYILKNYRLYSNMVGRDEVRKCFEK